MTVAHVLSRTKMRMISALARAYSSEKFRDHSAAVLVRSATYILQSTAGLFIVPNLYFRDGTGRRVVSQYSRAKLPVPCANTLVETRFVRTAQTVPLRCHRRKLHRASTNKSVPSRDLESHSNCRSRGSHAAAHPHTTEIDNLHTEITALVSSKSFQGFRHPDLSFKS